MQAPMVYKGCFAIAKEKPPGGGFSMMITCQVTNLSDGMNLSDGWQSRRQQKVSRFRLSYHPARRFHIPDIYRLQRQA